MQLSQVIIASLSLLSVGAVQQQSDIYYHEKSFLGASMWHFSPDGLSIFAPDGTLLKAHPKPMLCKEHTSPYSGAVSNDCSYFAYASDGHKYVWASSIAGDHAVQAFDIDTGDYAGYLDTCSTPIDMEYHPARDEMFVRCAQEDTAGGNPGEIDVFSSATLSSNLPMVKFNDTARPYGRLAIHSAMGPYGYSLAYDQPYITEMDLSSKTVAATYEVPGAYGGYDTTYSPVNQHLYFRSRVCCTCNSTDADVESCGRGPGKPVLVQTGPSKSDELQTGVCSGGCEGSRADTMGVVEFDTVNKVIVANHNIKEGTGWGADPVASPDGKWIVLLGNDGGQNVRIMQASGNGVSSASSVRDIPVDFEGGAPGTIVVSDVAFVQDENREILVVGASTDNDVVLVDLATFNTRKINVAPDVAESTGGGARALEWAVGTNYVWVNGGEAKEAYILEITAGIETASVYKTLTGVAAGNMLFVNNFERLRASSAAVGTSSDSSSMSSTAAQAMEESVDEKDGNVLGLVGVILGGLGLLAGFGALMLVSGKNAEPGLSVPINAQRDVEEAVEVKTLGSKQVN
jgi:WD40 repeat protein